MSRNSDAGEIDPTGRHNSAEGEAQPWVKIARRQRALKGRHKSPKSCAAPRYSRARRGPPKYNRAFVFRNPLQLHRMRNGRQNMAVDNGTGPAESLIITELSGRSGNVACQSVSTSSVVGKSAMMPNFCRISAARGFRALSSPWMRVRRGFAGATDENHLIRSLWPA